LHGVVFQRSKSMLRRLLKPCVRHRLNKPAKDGLFCS
jgi:hypothetical protein